ncbi:hypothetical protein DPMN_119416 [Dreissena polymorpha]|uniref:Uncharacterized protein n=1 Tax=Dreissena polymorpha TaxID=45954 RepID=A0A9D4GMF6_DREPO|nr:hypothetical protein DPMN_119416 [Dreissena polymorpha]
MVLKWTWQECPAHQPLISQPPTTQRNPPEGRRNRRELLKERPAFQPPMTQPSQTHQSPPERQKNDINLLRLLQ